MTEIVATHSPTEDRPLVQDSVQSEHYCTKTYSCEVWSRSVNDANFSEDVGGGWFGKASSFDLGGREFVFGTGGAWRVWEIKQRTTTACN